MVSTVTTVTVSAITSVTAALTGTTGFMAAIAIVTLLLLLVQKEVVSVGQGTRAKAFQSGINVGIVSLGIVFFIMVAVKLVQVLG